MGEVEKPLLSPSDSEEDSENKIGNEPKMMTSSINRPWFCTWFNFICAVQVFVVIGFIVKCVEVDHQFVALARDNEFFRGRVSDMEILVQELSANQTDNITNDIDLTKTAIKSTLNTGHALHLQESFEEMKGHLKSLTIVAGNLSMRIRKMNASSDSKLSRLYGKLKETNRDITRLHGKLIQLNKSVHTDIPPSFVSAVKILNQDLRMLRNSSIRNFSEVWERCNRTNARIEGILKLVAKRNESSRLKIAYRPENLHSRLKHVEKMQTEFHKDVLEIFKELRSKLNHSRDKSERHQQNLNKQIARVNESLHKALGIVVEGYNKKVDGMKKGLQGNVNDLIKDQKKIKNDFEETKHGFQEKHMHLDSTISGQAAEVRTIKENIETLRQNLDSATGRLSGLEDSKEDMKEKNNKQDSEISNQVSEVDNLKREVKDLENKLNRMESRQDELNLQMKKNKANQMPKIDIVSLLLIVVGLKYLY